MERIGIVIESGNAIAIAIRSAIINIAAKITAAFERRREIQRRRGRDIGIVHCLEIDDVDAFFGTYFLMWIWKQKTKPQPTMMKKIMIMMMSCHLSLLKTTKQNPYFFSYSFSLFACRRVCLSWSVCFQTLFDWRQLTHGSIWKCFLLFSIIITLISLLLPFFYRFNSIQYPHPRPDFDVFWFSLLFRLWRIEEVFPFLWNKREERKKKNKIQSACCILYGQTRASAILFFFFSTVKEHRRWADLNRVWIAIRQQLPFLIGSVSNNRITQLKPGAVMLRKYYMKTVISIEQLSFLFDCSLSVCVGDDSFSGSVE